MAHADSPFTNPPPCEPRLYSLELRRYRQGLYPVVTQPHTVSECAHSLDTGDQAGQVASPYTPPRLKPQPALAPHLL